MNYVGSLKPYNYTPARIVEMDLILSAFGIQKPDTSVYTSPSSPSRYYSLQFGYKSVTILLSSRDKY